MGLKEIIEKLRVLGLRFAKDENEYYEFLLCLLKNRENPEVKELEKRIGEAAIICREAGFTKGILPADYEAVNV
jgi:hypothetical protein